ncbi:hypothetical protein HanLR1_Chr02g0049011 [Helianthus annuus]|nr:hypothetical protein HanHA89_Chr02g0051251 [Helianthus annuus]KAJ0776734.1 hypothetical protein HanLR1_Chr02g0049011 [Helianthus annuus]
MKTSGDGGLTPPIRFSTATLAAVKVSDHNCRGSGHPHQNYFSMIPATNSSILACFIEDFFNKC